jgi:ABC-type branched-subunit amino acid transport system ATPase component
MNVLSDRPINKPEADEFGRSAFASAIARALVLPPDAPSIVVAIEGEWGSGKTSVLNMVAHTLKQHAEKPLVIALDSWLLAGSDAVVQTFLTQFAAALGKDNLSESAEKAADKVIRFSRLLTPIRLIPGIDPYASMLQNVLDSVGAGAKAYAEISKLDIQKSKVEVAAALKETGRAIVIILDDLDRLDPEETRQVFRLIKAVADFERVSYLLAYDPEPVYQALSFGNAYDGAAYLEKIVQVPYPLPLPSYLALKAYLRSRLEKIWRKSTLESFEVDRLEKLLSSEGGLGHAIRNPRDINRLANRLLISIPATRGEVNAADVVAFEALSILYPKTADTIRRRPYEFVGGWLRHNEPLVSDYLSSRFGSNRETQSREIPAWRKQLWEQLPPEEQRPLISLLDFLFRGFTGGTYISTGKDDTMEAELRICNVLPLLKLLSVGPVAGGVSAREVVSFLSDTTARAGLLEDLYESESAFGFLTFAAKFLDRNKVIDPGGVVTSLIDKAAGLVNIDRALAFRLIDEMASFSLHLLKSLPPETAQELCKLIAANEKSLTYSHAVVFYVARDHGLWPIDQRKVPDHKLVIKDHSTAQKMIDLWLSVVRTKASQSFSQLLREPGAVDILFRWGQFSSYEEVQQFVEPLTMTAAGIIEFQNAWLPENRMDEFHYFFKDWLGFKSRCEEYREDKLFRPDLWEFFRVLEAKVQEEAQGEPKEVPEDQGASSEDVPEEVLPGEDPEE